MKKLILAASLFAATFSVNAQDNTGKEYKPVAGNVTAEVALTGGLLGTSTSLGTSGVGGLGQLKFRYFLADDLALRVGLNLSRNSRTDKFYEAAPASGEGFRKYSTSNTLLNLGVEKHFTGTERLSTYAGADLTINFAGAKEEWENFNGVGFFNGYNAELKNASLSANGGAGANASTGLGLRVVVGGEYYFVEKVYLGTEFGWGFLTSKFKDTESTVTPGAGNPSTTVEVKSPGKTFNIAPQVVAAVRLGFRF